MYYTKHVMFGNYLRTVREGKRAVDRRFSLRQVAKRVGVEPAYLSKVERNEVRPPSEMRICLLAEELEINPDILCALAGKVRSDVLEIIRRRPAMIAPLVRRLDEVPDGFLREILRRTEEKLR